MLRRLASLSHQDSNETSHEHMSPQPGDGPSSPDTSRQGGLAHVLRGLTSSKLSKSSPSIASPSSANAQPTAEFVHAPAPAVSPNPPHGLSSSHMESFELLKNGSPNERIAAANSLKYAIAEYPLNPVLDIWYAAKDLIDPAKPAAARAAGWELLTECVKHEASSDLERQEYFTTLSAPANSEDFHLQLAALVDLTRRGRILTGFDYELLPLLTNWLWESYNVVRAARRKASRSSKGASRNRAVASGEEKNLAQLFNFLIDVIKFSFNNADESAVTGLIDRLLAICMSTSVEEDLRSSIAVIDAIVTFGSIPEDKLKGCVQVLSSIYCMVGSLQKDSWNTLSNLFKSHNGQATIRILLDILRNNPTDGAKEKDVNREIRGALAVLQKVLSKSPENGYPGIPFALLADGLAIVAKTGTSIKTLTAILQLLNALFDGGDGHIHRLIIDEDWSVILEAAATCSKRAIPGPRDSDGYRSPIRDEKPEEALIRELIILIKQLDVLINQKSDVFVPRATIISFLTEVHQFLPDETASSVLNYFQQFRCCSPSDLQWEENLTLVLKGFFGNRDRSSQIRLRALETIMDAYEVVDLVGDDPEESFIPQLAKSILQDVSEETDVLVLEGIMSLMVSVVVSCDMELFDYIVDALRGIVIGDRLKSPIPSSASHSPFAQGSSQEHLPQGQSPSNVVAKGYVKIFVQTMDYDSGKSLRLYHALINIVKSSHCEVDARLTAMKLLFRLRADWANRIFITKTLETNFVAASLCRTPETYAKKQAEEAAQSIRLLRNEHGGSSRSARGISFSQGQGHERGMPIRSASVAAGSGLLGSSGSAARYHQLWSLPDPEALPESVTGVFSPVLVSHSPGSAELVMGEEVQKAKTNIEATALDIAAWLEAVLGLLHGCDWEVYSFALVHLPSQLSNHAIFRDAIPQIQELRRLICEQIRTNSFQEPPNASGLRRADVAICLFHSLTMILSYHDHFQKGDEDEIVKTFVHGIATWERSAKCCIHALSICCHELPLSTSKSLVQLLTKMSTIITQPHVSIHILEFLACLSRLHNVYVNFREEEYKIVFGICIRYLQSVRDKKTSNRNSHASEPSTPATSTGNLSDAIHPSATDDLPQYVYALAYHVILFWFLALKLPDRATLVGWLVRNIYNEIEDAHTDNEQALTSIDFMQRYTYADVEESSQDPLFTSDRFGEIIKKRWLVGYSIVTVNQATTTGWAQIVKRQPSGTSAFTIRETFDPPPPHQTPNYVDISREGQVSTNTILPSHIMVQLMSSIPQGHDLARPIPLPEDDAVERAIRVFDRSSTVDGHKVGVIYIGEGQTDEVEILGNVSGSSDYMEFLNNLGTLTKLKGATFNTHGLDREFDSDGQYTFCWRDRVTEIVFHVTTQMPTNLEHDPRCTMKKRHIGNDFVNIVFNDSGLPFRFDTFPGDFNFVHIVITPASRASFIAARDASKHSQPFYRVQVLSKPGFPEISPASEMKIVSLKALPGLIRLLALNASVFSHVWANREGGEHVSSWRSRLRAIKRLREKYTPSKSGQITPSASQNSSLGGAPPLHQQQPLLPQGEISSSRPASTVRDSFTSLRRTSVATFFTSTSEQTSHRSSMLSSSTTTNDTEIGPFHAQDSHADTVDFSKWA
ncbi:Tuberous sclerosis 2 [Fusarium oxysporum f. sp. cepae]|uniref:Tuberous sclerosis 2 n=1 Tax=Fusarium oxysporum f. sp. cepae TaxID=396571 RepID=A0A3L6NT26_FUSOX|nr:Tuberous sclerosis 2 [Fusarium oxysporum f. sp. cepae]RKK59553.1 Tuberous sclerosis 2 [Fusarium oxysporum f. sp. cepae]RKK59696.1 Tuberous sclerosis 2 [Fusarium oxysporum f. sp. cepae]